MCSPLYCSLTLRVDEYTGILPSALFPEKSVAPCCKEEPSRLYTITPMSYAMVSLGVIIFGALVAHCTCWLYFGNILRKYVCSYITEDTGPQN